MGTLPVLIISVILYMVLMIVIGWYTKSSESNTEEYFLASRGLKTFVLFCAVLGTNMSSFVMLGMAGQSYRAGIGMYGLVMGGAILGISLLPFIFGLRAWAIGKKFNYYTPTEYLRNRFQSPVLAILVFIVFVVYTLPYITIGQIGAGAAFASFTSGVIPFWLGSLLVTVIVGYYVWSGGMKGTAYTNVAQVIIFISFLFLAVFLIGWSAGGPTSILEKVKAVNQDLLHRGNPQIFNWKTMFSQLLLFSICNFTLPHLYIRYMVAKDSISLKKTSIIYPLGVLCTWVPACIIGFWGAGLIPGLEGTASDNILFLLSGEYLPVWMFGFAVVALLAIVMSSMDAQVLTVSTLFTNDILKDRLNIENSVILGRVFVLIILGLSYLLSLAQPATVFQISQAAFTGTSALAPVLVGAMYWKRLNKYGAIASVLTGIVLVPAYFASTFFPNSDVATFISQFMPTFGFDPIVPVMIAAIVVMVGTTWLAPGYSNPVADKQFEFLNIIYNTKNKERNIVVPNQPNLES